MDSSRVTDAFPDAARDAGRLQNRSLFRAVNERVAAACRGDVFQLLCECGDAACVDGLDIPLRQFERIRRHRGRFVVRTDHASWRGMRVVERHGTWCVEDAGD